jgi:hypothetical protein
MNKYILTEFLELENDSSLLTEQERKMNESGEHLILAGRLQKADVRNGNGRVYPLNILKREVENYKKLVNESRALGELDHPDSSVIELKNASHLITHIEMRGTEVIGKIKVLDTPSGTIAKKLSSGGVKLGVSSRGLGSTKEQGGDTVVQDDFQLICFDLVSEPSTTGAFLFKEGKDLNIFTKADKIYRAMNDILMGE